MKLTEELLKTKIFENSLQTCEYLSGYQNRASLITLRCIKHNLIFTTRYENVGRAARPHHVCPYCKEEDCAPLNCVCDYCGKTFHKSKTKFNNYNFCCRECKDKAQQLESGSDFMKLRPNHYGDGRYIHYREKALKDYPHQCACCGWNEDVDILEVHHIDENRANNRIDNLVILCPICHKKLTTHKYKLTDDYKIIPMGD